MQNTKVIEPIATYEEYLQVLQSNDKKLRSFKRGAMALILGGILLMHYLLYFRFKMPAAGIQTAVVGYFLFSFFIAAGLLQLLHGKQFLRINEFRGVSYTFGLFGGRKIIGPDKTLIYLYQGEQEER